MGIRENLEAVRARIEAACERAGRDVRDVVLLPVSKTKPIEMLEEMAALGETRFGENHVQEIVQKKALHPEYVFHMIGHLQRNKVKDAVGRVELIHSVDSLRLAKEISKESLKKGVVSDVLLEINAGCEESKFGYAFEEAEDAVREIAALPAVRIRGFMCVAPNVSDPEENRPIFRKMYDLSVDIGNKKIDNVKTDILSMGMTNDFEIAVEEGATIIRIGTALFGRREYQEVEK